MQINFCWHSSSKKCHFQCRHPQVNNASVTEKSSILNCNASKHCSDCNALKHSTRIECVSMLLSLTDDIVMRTKIPKHGV